MGRKSPRAGFSISAEATSPRLPHRQRRETGMSHHLMVGPCCGRISYVNRGGRVVASPRQSRRCSGRAPVSSGWSGMRGKTCRSPYASARKPSLRSSTSGVCSKTITRRPSADARDVRRRAVQGQGVLADNQRVVGFQLGIRVHLPEVDPEFLQQRGGLALGIEEGDGPGRFRSGRFRQHVESKRVGLFIVVAEPHRGAQLVLRRRPAIGGNRSATECAPAVRSRA